MKDYVALVVLLLLQGSCPAYTYKNVALRGKATQSVRSTNSRAAAYNGIDGNRNPDFGAGSCTHTAEQTNPWWRVDLLDIYRIVSISITNREDCCPERMDGAEIHVGNSPIVTGAENTVVGTITTLGAGATFTLQPNGHFEGQYVSVMIPGSAEVLTLCEVEVYGYRAPTGEDLSVRGKASQSSLYQTGVAYNAVDGNRDPDWSKGSCTHTQNDLGPWWRLDLGATYKVFSVQIVNRNSNGERLIGAEIRIGNSLDNNGNDNPRCAVITNIVGCVIPAFQCDGMDGRYVTIVIPGRREYLTLCEVEVYGSVLD
ncbi:uncharacterized protein LOC143016915 [Genypterus blacodes]|uniref:uncharacterized protein LOC143016915 n=1 Tax=Genypterus blacodes TaxID=154954 RepID=UPI003F772A4C